MSKYEKFSLEERAYGKGRKTQFQTNSVIVNPEWADRDLKEIGIKDEEMLNALYPAWLEGFFTHTDHNPLPKQPKFDAPTIRQYIKFQGMKRGVVVAYLSGDTIYIGWSIRRKSDKFNPSRGIIDAISEAVPLFQFDPEQLPKFFSKSKDVYGYTYSIEVKQDILLSETFEERVRYTVFRVIGRALHYYQQASLRF